MQELADATSVEDAWLRGRARRMVAKTLTSYAEKNVAFMREVGYACRTSDAEGPLWMFIGFPMIGWTPGANGLMQRARLPVESIQEWRSRRVEGNTLLINRICSSGDQVVDDMAFTKTLEEERVGAIAGPYLSLVEVPVECPCVAPRTGIWECHGDSDVPTVRNIDDLLVGEQNLTVGTISAHRPTNCDALTAQTRAAAEAFPNL
jgi:hypothetical protein